MPNTFILILDIFFMTNSTNFINAYDILSHNLILNALIIYNIGRIIIDSIYNNIITINSIIRDII